MQYEPDAPTEPESDSATEPEPAEAADDESTMEHEPAEAADDENTAELDGFGRDFDAVDAALEALDNDDLDQAEAHVAKLSEDQPGG